ncbi:MAG: nucleoside deaminase, partial [Clostridiales bacterium]|nr:nucleoside deaminase [Clostridiales bacterium]
MEHSYYMQSALEEAQKALFHNEIPIGCVIILNQRIIARAFNKRTLLRNTIMHAEMIAIDQACAALGDWRLEGCSLYVTIEP